MDHTTLNRATATLPKNREYNIYYFTPTQAKVCIAVEFYDRIGIEYFKEDIFRSFNVFSQEEWKYLSDNSSPRRLNNNPDREEYLGRKSLISPEKIRELEQVLETEGIEARFYIWDQLGFEGGLKFSRCKVHRVMGTMDYHKCIALRREWMNEKTAKDRMNWATVMLDKYVHPEDGHLVRLSDKVQFGYGAKDKLNMI